MKSDTCKIKIGIIEEIIKGLLGKKAWNARIGYGSFVTIEFGNPIVQENDQSSHGEWHLWVYICSWRIEKDNHIIVGDQDSKERMNETIKLIDGTTLESFEVLSTVLDAILRFSDGLTLRLFSILSNDEENDDSPHWMLYMPNNRILIAGPDDKLVIETE